MKRTRVGTFSLGVLLVAIGVLILVCGIKGVDGVQLILKFWPIILISIGLEILYFVYKNKGEEMKLKYDVLSVVVFLFLLIISSGVFVFNEFMDNDLSNVVMRDIKIRANSDMVIKEYEFDKSKIDKVKIDNSGNLTVRQSADDKIRIKTSVIIKASSKEIIEKYKNQVVDIKEINRVLVVSDFNEKSIGRLVEIGDVRTTYELYIPENVELSIENDNGTIQASNLKNKLDFYLNGAVLNCYGIQGEIFLKGKYTSADFDNIKGNIYVDMNGENVSFDDVKGKISGKIANYRMQLQSVIGECDLRLSNCNADIILNDVIQENFKVNGEDSQIDLEISKEQQGEFYIKSNREITLNDNGIFKEGDMTISADEKVIEKTVGEGPEIEIKSDGGTLTIE